MKDTMSKVEHYFKKDEEIRRAMAYWHEMAMKNHEAVHPNWYALQQQLIKNTRHYWAYCKRHGLTNMPRELTDTIL